ncbi:MAG: argininosuccinate lyase [Pseudomonadota bacterium]
MPRFRLTVLAGLLLTASQVSADDCDFYCYLGEANRASLVALREANVLDDELARTIADGIDTVMANADADPSLRSSNYLDFEEQLIAVAGAEASQVHVGRSRQDLHGTVRRLLVRDAFLETFGQALVAREAVLTLAATYADVVIPAYTHGVQAQPTSAGHYLLAFSAALERDAQRLREAFARFNRSPLGAAALGTSGYATDRERLATLLGFAGPVVNAYDANLVSSSDFKLEFATVLSLSAIPVGQFAQNLHTQYHNVVPWFVLDASTTSGSSIMPQKRNPRPIDRLRTRSSQVIGQAQTLLLTSHNTNTGMHDYRVLAPTVELLASARDMYRRYGALLGSISIDRERALAEVHRGYSTTTEIADALVRSHGLPFRQAHHFASELTTWCLQRGRALRSLTDEELREVYREANGDALPVAIEIIRAAMDPRQMVVNRRGLGGPQPAEVERMLATHRDETAAHAAWLEAVRQGLADAASELDRAFSDIR